jgi:hypothetical protein
MSMLVCNCGAYIDSDFDCDCFVDNGDIIACESCREQMEADGLLDVETNSTRKVNGETFPAFVARMEASAEEPS